MKVKRHLVALAATAAIVGAGSGEALACGSGCAPAAPNTASQSSSNSQILPISLGLGAAVPVNANVPIGILSGGPEQGWVKQESRARSDAAAKNNETTQSVRQQGEGGGNSASQSASNSQILPVAAAIGAAIPVNANVPVAVLSGGPKQGDVEQRGSANAGAEALNNETNQSIEQSGDGKHGAGNSASQSSSSSQILPIALGLGAAVPVNANVPVSVLSSGPKQGEVTQRADADAKGEALNNETEQTIDQRSGRDGKGGNSASQSASNSQILPIALGAALAIPVNANVPVSILSSGPKQGDVNQHSDGDARARGVNVEHDQDVVQRGGKDGANSASQSASNSQILPIALGAALAIPVNANIPIAILSSGPVQGDVNQRGDADAKAEALNNETEQSVVQNGGNTNASQSASNSQILPIALGAALAVPINLNLPISILSSGPAQGEVRQKGDADASAEALSYELDQSVNGDGAKQRQGAGATVSQSAVASQLIGVALGADAATPLNLNLPVSILSGSGDGPLGIVNRVLATVQATLADPVGTIMAVLKDPIGSVVGLLSGL